MWNPRRLVLNIEAICGLAWLLALVGLQALLGLNGRLPVTVLPREPDTVAESEPSTSDPPASIRPCRSASRERPHETQYSDSRT
jgi:hypothetical protein